MQHEAAVLPDHAAATTLEVSFSGWFGRAKAVGLYGKGQVRIDSEQISLTGSRLLRPGMKTHTFAQQDIFDVEAIDATVYFDVWGGTRTTPLRVRFTTDSIKTANAAAAMMSKRQTHDFIRTRAEEDLFSDQLDKVSKRVITTPVLVGLNVLIFILMAIAGAGIITAHPEVTIRWGSNFGPRTLTGQWWRLLTSTFIHFGLLHLIINMVALAQVGPIVERLYGSWRFLALYIFAGLFGETVSLLWHPTANGAGASGAIFGVIGGMLSFVLHPRNEVPKTVMQSIRGRTIPIVLVNLALGMLILQIDNAAHVGGLFGGALIGILLARPLPKLPVKGPRQPPARD